MDAESLPRCPSCGIALNIPVEFRGRVIRCLECRTDLQSTADGVGPLTVVSPKNGRYPAKVFVPLAALILLGAMGVMVNGFFAVQFRNNPDAIVAYTESTIAQMNASNFLSKDKAKPVDPVPELTDEERRQQIIAHAAVHGESLTRTMMIFAGISAVSLLGGLAFAYGRWQWLAVLGCLAAIGNLNHGCCFPGAVAGVWGLFAILSNEGQRHFNGGKSLPPTRSPG